MNQKQNESNLKDYSYLGLDSDHLNKPFWVAPDGHIFVDTLSKNFKFAQDFLIAIAEPVCRTEFVHEYKLTKFSLYAGVSVGLTSIAIIETLKRSSKTEISDETVLFIKNSTLKYGQIKMILRNNRYFVEFINSDVMNELLSDLSVRQCFVLDDTDVKCSKVDDKVEDVDAYVERMDADELNDNNDSHLLEINQNFIEKLQKRCQDLGYPLIAEYDFKLETVLPTIGINLKSNAILRPYQEKCLSKMFGNGRAHSGVVVLPCGAGKTLVGVTAACTVDKPTVVICNSNVSVEQWKSQFKIWSTISDSHISTSKDWDKSRETKVFISTYSMISMTRNRSLKTQALMNWLKERVWGLLILDEVHTTPADKFRNVLTTVKAHCKLGLTATLLREDDKINDLNFLIGPKLYEANWLELQNNGYLAKVQCSEVSVKMPFAFHHEYLKTPAIKQPVLYIMNPNKFRLCEYLIKLHEKRNDKIIVFCDNIFALEYYAKKLKCPYIYGETVQEERLQILQNFQTNERVNTIFVSKIADTSFDLPDANVLIQISSKDGSERQETQRLGRILRAKPDKINDEFNAFFYTIISDETVEVQYASKRRQFLMNQGYSYKVINEFEELNSENMCFSTDDEQQELLKTVLDHIKTRSSNVETSDDSEDN